MRPAHSEAPLALTLLSARPPKVFHAHAFRFTVALALSFAPALHAQLPGIDAPTGAAESTGKDVAGRPVAVPDTGAAAGADGHLKNRVDPQKSRPGRSDAERAASSAHAVSPGSSTDKIEGSGPISRGEAASEARGADRPGAPPEPSVVLNDAIKLCERLAGVEREICLRQAEENRERAAQAGVGSTPGRGGMTVDGATAPGAR
jgi:hypothetical protein